MSGSSGLRASILAKGAAVLDYVSPRTNPRSSSLGYNKGIGAVFNLPPFPPFPPSPKPLLFPTPPESFLFKKVIEPIAAPLGGLARKTIIYGVLTLTVAAILFFFARGIGSRLAGAR